MATANNTLTTDFNVTPYYDDYDETKGYYRILYKPGFAVQGRELTQMQTILQKQIDRFGKHVFREGSIVLPENFNIKKNIEKVDYVKVNDVNAANTSDIDISSFLNKELFGLTNNVSAYVVNVADGTSSNTNTKTLYVRYTSSSNANPEIKTFQPSEILTTATGQTLTVLGSETTPIGEGSRFILPEGVFFAKEHFIRFNPTSAILSRYSTTPTCRVGFNVIEEIVNYTEDASLLDPALEASNYSAPGADRLKLSPNLEVRDFDDTEGAPNFVELFSMKDGVLTEIYDRPQYNVLGDEIAKRTFDESGDYYVRGLTVRIREDLDNNVNGGYAFTGANTLLRIGVEPGLAYVKGHEVGLITTNYDTTIDKANTYNYVPTQFGSASMGSYVIANEVKGKLELDKGQLVYLYNTAAKRVTNKGSVSTGPSAPSAIIGTARVLGVDYFNGTLGTNTGNIAIYLTDVRMNGTNSFAQTKTIYRSGFYADPVLENNNAVLRETATSTLLYTVGSNAVRSLKDELDNNDFDYQIKKTQTGQTIDVVPGSTSTMSISYSASSGGTEALIFSSKSDIIVTVDADASISTGWTVSTGGGTTTLTSGSNPTFSRFNLGDKIQISGNSSYFTIVGIPTENTLLLDTALPTVISGNTISKAYMAGDIIDLNTKGIKNGDYRTVTTGPNSITIDFKEEFGSSVPATVTYRVGRGNAVQIGKTPTSNVFVAFNFASANAYPVTGPLNLGVPDVYRIKKILRKSGSVPTSILDTSATDVTRFFTFDTGQRDTYYEHSSITPAGISLTSTDCLLVQFDYFAHDYTSGRGYFSVDSYPTATMGYENIPIFKSPSTKIEYDLRNFIDFRPVKDLTATPTTTATAASVNPAVSGDFKFVDNGIRLPAPSTTFDYAFSYFLPRRDIITLDKDGKVGVVKGVPGPNPTTPTVPENVMALASVFVSPFPSLAPNYAQILNRKDLSVIVKKLSNIRFTMRDIGVLRDRIVNLEYYAALTTLEKSAVDMQIVDENNQNRFKNGIFVDSFRDHSLGDISDPNYRVIVDEEEKSIRPSYTMRSDYYKLLSNTALTRTGDLVHLPYTHKILIEQPRVTSYRNVEVSSYKFLGNLYLTPDIDVWVDTQQLADNQIVTGDNINGVTEGTVTTYNEWQKKIVGYKLYKKSTGELLATFNASEKDLAYNNAYWLARNVEFNKNTIGLTSSGKADSGAKFETIVETVYENSRTGVETFTAINQDTQQLGNKVVDVSIQPYIRPQVIACHARGMKPNTRLHVFFDSENMNGYVRQITSEQHRQFTVNGTLIDVVTTAEGTPLVSDANGNAYFLLRLPTGDSKRFRVGQKEVVVIDSPTNSQEDASTLAKNYFVAEGLTQYKQDTILTTRTVITTQKDVSQTNQTTSQFIQQIRPSCSAYSFLPKAPDGEEGVFITKVDLFFQQKHPTLGFWIEIREMDSGGDITRNQVPLSEIWVESSDPRYKVSDDGNTPTTLEFPAPVFLYNNVQYALVIHTIGLNPDTYIWISRMTEFDKNTKQKVDQRPLTGTFFTTNNNLNWDIVKDVDLKVNIYRAAFATNVQGEAILGQKPVEKLVIENLTSDFNSYGETIVGNQRLTLSGGTISGANVGNDFFVGSTSKANAVVLSFSGSVAAVSNIKFTTGEQVWRYYGANGANSLQRSTIASIQSGSGKLEKYRFVSNSHIVDILSSNGGFYVGDTIRGLTSNARASVVSIQDFRYTLVDFEPAYLKFNKTDVNFAMSTVSNTGTTHSGYIPITDNENYYFDQENRVMSRSKEMDPLVLNGDSSNKVRVLMSSASEYVTPILDLAKTHSVYVDNIVNANTYQETYTGVKLTLDNAIANTGNLLSVPVLDGYANSTVISRSGNTVTITVPSSDYYTGNTVSIYHANNVTVRGIANVVSVFTNYTRNLGGALYNKYISRPIVLAEGQDAEDILVILTAYRPEGTDVPVWIRIQNNEDGDAFSDISWIQLEKVNDSVYSSVSDRNDFREFTYRFPTSMMTAPEPQLGAVQYRNSQGTQFTGFKTFALKIGLTATNSAIIPRVADLRAVALQI